MRRIFLPTDENVKVLGRTVMCDDCRLLCASASGVEFEYTGSFLKVSFLGDSSTNGLDDLVYWRDDARVEVLVDGRIMLDTTIKKEKESFIVYGEDPATLCEKHVVRIIKLSEPRMSSVGLAEIEIESTEPPKPTKDNEKLVEFIGDSITCGYGVDTLDELCPFSTGTENAAKAYAYLAANELGVDYSLVSYSGHGFVSGWTPDPSVPKKEELVQPYYDITAYSYNNFRGLEPQSVPWKSKRVPNIIVINIGTNDFSYTQDDEAKIKEYRDCYVEFLSHVREKNKSSHIICSLGVMGDELYPAIEEAVKEYMDNTGDTNISAFRFAVQNPELDGYGADYHPSPATQKKAARAMADELKKWL